MRVVKCLFLLGLFLPVVLLANSKVNCYSNLTNDTLTLGNNYIERKFLWNGGNLITCTLTDKVNNQEWTNNSTLPDFYISDGDVVHGKSNFESNLVAETSIHPSYLEIVVSYSLDLLDIKRVYRIYDSSPSISCQTFLKGSTLSLFGDKGVDFADLTNIEFTEDMNSNQVTALLDHFDFGGNHWNTEIVEFFDMTDWNNNLVSIQNIIPYRKNVYRGNLLFAHNQESENGFFLLKEAPSSSVQLSYDQGDFITEFGKFSITSLGINADDIKEDEWTSTYSYVVGVCGGEELDRLKALRSYQKNIRLQKPDRDEMIMMNTWGDRSQDALINEEFCLKELEYAAKLGVTHFQIDDGWQTGRSPNSAQAGGSFSDIWSNDSYWKLDVNSFPNGLHQVMKSGKDFGIEVCLWFTPSIQDDFADWEKDVKAIVDLYNEYGIRIYKIDGLYIVTKKGENNLKKMFNAILEQTSNEVVFNLDATAMRRSGYHMYNEYGNIFLENRYTDWGNYYPYQTLRNLWMLARYVPAEKLQIEFLNKWRNKDKYNDCFAPAHYSLDYIFATTMAGQPLAWLEGGNLPEEAFLLRTLIEVYKTIQYDFHTGTILPIGDEPSGRSWTGFQSILSDDNGYFIFYRENNDQLIGNLKTWFKEGDIVKCTALAGNGESFITTIKHNGVIEISLDEINSFALYKYILIK